MQDTVMFSGIIVGDRPRLKCKVSATKTTLDTDAPVFSDYRIMESVASQIPDKVLP